MLEVAKGLEVVISQCSRKCSKIEINSTTTQKQVNMLDELLFPVPIMLYEISLRKTLVLF